MRGLNSKLAYAKDFVSSNKLNFVALLETHVKKENARYVSNYINPRFSWLFNYDFHHNGRIWLGWDPSKWSINLIGASAQHLSCLVHCLTSGKQFYISVVYGFNSYIDRRQLWCDLHNIHTLIDGNNHSWCISGDFNAYISLEDSNGGQNLWTPSMSEFKQCVHQLGLTDLRYFGCKYTWWDCSATSPLYRKLDRVLVNGAWLLDFPLSWANFLPRGLSDHSPATVMLGIPGQKVFKPFQFFNHLIHEPSFLDEVASAWSDQVSGNAWFILTTKLKRVKSAMINLNKKKGNLAEAVCTARANLLAFQDNLRVSPSTIDLEEECQLMTTYHNALRTEEVFLKQKSRVHWLRHGDGNNRYFFNYCKARWNSNKILALANEDGVTLTSHSDIAGVAVNYFKSLLGTEKLVDSLPPNLPLPKLTDAQISKLTSPVTPSEILVTLKSMGNNKCPGPDGFTAEFFIASWPIVGEDVCNAILSFFLDSRLPRIVNATGIALIPKNENPTTMNHYRPISCCNILYKCISKLITARLKPIMSDIISPCQSAFIPGRSIGDNIMLAQSLCRNYHINSGQPRCAIKLDLSKAFDSLSWDFLFSALEAMNFPPIVIHWIKMCVTSCMYSVKINGSLEGFFEAGSGIRQGDPLSPYLFVLAMEVLTACLNNVVNTNQFRFHYNCHSIKLSHLIFADDVFLFCYGNPASVKALLDGISWFSSISGLNVNCSKSSIFFCNVDVTVQQEIIQASGLNIGSLPITYLGLPLITSRLSKHHCIPLIHKICSRVDSWTNRLLSYTGRLQLIKSVLNGIQSYWSLFLFLPKGILKKIQCLLANFLWGGLHKVSWNECCLPLNAGGLGIKDLFTWNKAAVLFQLWRLACSTLLPSRSIWVLWFNSCILKSKALWTIAPAASHSWCTRKILNSRSLGLQYIRYSAGVNSRFLLWHDPWVGRPLIQQFSPQIVSLAASTNLALISSAMTDTGWYVSPSNHYLLIELRHLLSTVAIQQRDKILWDGQATVSISLIWNSICNSGLPLPWASAVWHSWSIKKCSFITWLASKGKLLTKDRMIRFGMHTDATCPLCSTHPESISHLLLHCSYGAAILNHCPFQLANDWEDYLQGNFFVDPVPSHKAQLGHLFFSIAVYLIWKERNCRLHAIPGRNPVAVLWDVKRLMRERLFSCPSFRKAVAKDYTLTSLMY